jgi:phage terminase large subunit-like protein
MATNTVPEDAFKRWTPTAQEKALARLKEMTVKEWHPFYCPRPNCDGNHHIAATPSICEPTGRAHDWREGHRSRWSCRVCGVVGTPQDAWLFRHGRANQHPPKGDWLTWLNRGGRGSGKTRTGAEWTHRRTKVSPRIALVAATGPDGRAILVEGESGILATAAPDNRPEWEPSKKELTWPNGAKAFLYSAEEPDRLRGPQHNDAWLDEPAHMPLIDEVWSNLLFGLRLIGPDENRICCTTTPLPIQWMKDLVAEDDTVSVVASTYDNIANLAPKFAKTVLRKYEGTRKGRQEIHGEILADVEGALWLYDYFEGTAIRDALPTRAAQDMDRIVVGVDPAGTHRKKSDETGIIVVGVWREEYYVLADYSGKYSPSGWANRALNALADFHADALIVETNYGGDMVRDTIENAVDSKSMMPRIEEVHSRRGKVIRADPIVALYEKGLVHHVGTLLGGLEDQLVSWVPGNDSPDRLDALVHAMYNLARTVDPATVADPTELSRLTGTAGGGVPPGTLPGRHLGIVRTA